MYQISVHEHFRRTLARLSGDKRKLELIHKCLKKLMAGDWQGGTRVKRLHGGNADILEARVEDGDRLLFTLGQGHLLICHDVVTHDVVSRNAKRARYSRINTGSVDFEKDYQVDGRDLLDELFPPMEEDKEVGPDVVAVEDAWRTSYINNTAPRLTTPPNHVWQDEQRLADWCAEMDLSLDLLLHPDQEKIVLCDSPIILSGGAGSGKSTIILHSLLRQMRSVSKSKILYVTFKEGLCRHSEALYKRLAEREGYNDLQSDTVSLTFLTYDDLCRRLIADAGNASLSGAMLTLSEFSHWYDRLPRGARPDLPAGDVWSEIQGVIKGRVEQPDQDMLTKASYKELCYREGLLGSGSEELVFRFTQTYKNYLKRHSRYDQMDLTRAAWSALQGLSGSDRERWHFQGLFCDEVQDLTKLQMRLLREVWNGGEARPFLTGDEHQVIYPSAFRWADIQQLFHEDEQARSYIPSDRKLQHCTLTRNFRSTDGILKLAAATLDGLKKELVSPFPSYRFKPLTVGSHEGPPGLPPVRLMGNEGQCLQALAALPSSERRIILTRDKETRESLIESLHSVGVLNPAVQVETVENYKGMETDCVIVWRFFAASPDFWKSIQKGERQSSSLYNVLTECNRLYVALTRAQRYLAVFDALGDPHPWSLSAYNGVTLKEVNCDWLGKVQTAASSPDQWRDRANLYETHQNYRLAIAAYVNAKDDIGVRRCEALQAESEGRFADAAECWYQTTQWRQATACFLQVNDVQGQVRCEAEMYEESKDWYKAREAWQRAHKLDREAIMLEMLGQWQKAHQCLKHYGDASALHKFELRWLANQLAILEKEVLHMSEDVVYQTAKLSSLQHGPENHDQAQVKDQAVPQNRHDEGVCLPVQPRKENPGHQN